MLYKQRAVLILTTYSKEKSVKVAFNKSVSKKIWNIHVLQYKVRWEYTEVSVLPGPSAIQF